MTNIKITAQIIVDKLKAIVPDNRNHPLHEPQFTGNEWNYIKDCLDTGWVSSVGRYVDRFERQLEEFTGIKHAIAVMNGTAALHVSLRVAGVETDEEVLVPDLTFIATANAVTYCGAVPHFIDVEERTLGIDPKKLEAYLTEICSIQNGQCINNQTGRRVRALIAMHTFGHPVDLDPVLEICNRYNLILIEDAAESLGSYYKGMHTGHWGRMTALSFNGNKIVTTGGGGAVLTNDSLLAKELKHVTTTAKLPHRWEFVHDQAGYNYRLPNLNAALGCAQLERLPEFLQHKRKIASIYHEAFHDVEGIRCFKEAEFAKSNYWLNALLLDDADLDLRNALLELSNDNGIMTRPAWTLMHKLPMFHLCPAMPAEMAEELIQRIVNIPSSPYLGDAYA